MHNAPHSCWRKYAQVERELARERGQWEERQELHRAEAEALRLQLQRLPTFIYLQFGQ